MQCSIFVKIKSLMPLFCRNLLPLGKTHQLIFIFICATNADHDFSLRVQMRTKIKKIVAR